MTRRVIGVLLVGGVVGAVGCSDTPPPIVEARPIEKPEPAKADVQLAPGAKPEKSDPASAEVVAAAIRAHTANHPEALQRLKTVIMTRDGQGNIGGPVPMPQKWIVHAAWPDKIRIKLEMPGNQVAYLGRSGNKYWRSGYGPETMQELPAEDAAALRLDSSWEWLWLLFPLTDPATVVAPAPEARPNDRPAVGVRVWAPGVTDAVLHFDKETKLLAQITWDGREGVQKVTKEAVVLSSKPYGGITLPDKMVVRSDGRYLFEWSMSKLETPDQIDPKVFEGP